MSRALVTGGSGGIGERVVRRLIAAGHDVIFTYHRGVDRAQALAHDTGARVVVYDQGDSNSLEELAQLVSSEDIDVLVNNGSEVPTKKLLLKTDVDGFVEYVSASLRGVLRLSLAFGACARDRGRGGCIINVLTSYVLSMPPAKLSAYVTSKHALLGLTRSMAVELLRYGVRVNAVSPSVTRTNFISDLPERFVEQLEAGLPMGRLADPDEVAAVIEFLASPGASYLNGVNIPVAGGQAC